MQQPFVSSAKLSGSWHLEFTDFNGAEVDVRDLPKLPTEQTEWIKKHSDFQGETGLFQGETGLSQLSFRMALIRVKQRLKPETAHDKQPCSQNPTGTRKRQAAMDRGRGTQPDRLPTSNPHALLQ